MPSPLLLLLLVNNVQFMQLLFMHFIAFVALLLLVKFWLFPSNKEDEVNTNGDKTTSEYMRDTQTAGPRPYDTLTLDRKMANALLMPQRFPYRQREPQSVVGQYVIILNVQINISIIRMQLPEATSRSTAPMMTISEKTEQQNVVDNELYAYENAAMSQVVGTSTTATATNSTNKAR